MAYKELRNISIIIISLILSGCYVQKGTVISKLNLGDFIKDYESDFQNYCKNDTLGALHISIKVIEGHVDKIIIEDYSIRSLYRDIRLNEDSVDNIMIGTVGQYPTRVFYDSNTEIPNSLKIPADTLLIQKANIVPKYFLIDENGNKKEIDFDEGLDGTDPVLISTYFPSYNKKILEIYGMNIIELKYKLDAKE